MNYCTKCESFYKTPGTCNCFAPPVQVAPQSLTIPSTPVIPWPTYPYPNPYIGDPMPGTPGYFTVTSSAAGATIVRFPGNVALSVVHPS